MPDCEPEVMPFADAVDKWVAKCELHDWSEARHLERDARAAAEQHQADAAAAAETDHSHKENRQ